jgi:general secretion pathway protein N
MIRPWRAGAIGIAVYLLILVATFPVSYLTGAIEQRVAGLQLREVSGSPWSGHADRVIIQGTEIGGVRWALRPLRLLAGNLEYRVELRGAQQRGSGLLDLSFAGRLHGRDITARFAPTALFEHFSPVGVAAAGEISLQLDSCELGSGLPTAVQGTLRWPGARVTAPLQLQLGDLAFDLGSTDTGLVATVAQGGTLGLSGNVTLQRNGRYAVNLQLQPGTAVGVEDRQTLDSLLDRQPGGGYRIRAAGKL